MIQVEAAIIITGVTRLISTEILYKESKQDLFNLNLNLCEIFILLNDLDMTRFI
jgi:hypothetical protein